jgi:hypothetical protein
LHDEEFPNLNILEKKSSKVRRTKHITIMGEKRDEYDILAGKPY